MSTEGTTPAVRCSALLDSVRSNSDDAPDRECFRVGGASFDAEGVTVLHCDCMELMRRCGDKSFDLAVVDPPYGISVAENETFGMGRKTNSLHRDAIPSEGVGRDAARYRILCGVVPGFAQSDHLRLQLFFRHAAAVGRSHFVKLYIDNGPQIREHSRHTRFQRQSLESPGFVH